MNDEELPDRGIYSTVWLAKAGLRHAIYTYPLNVWIGICEMLDYMADPEDEFIDSEKAVDILVQYGLSGHYEGEHVGGTSEYSPPAETSKMSEEDIEAEVEKIRKILGIEKEEEE